MDGLWSAPRRDPEATPRDLLLRPLLRLASPFALDQPLQTWSTITITRRLKDAPGDDVDRPFHAALPKVTNMVQDPVDESTRSPARCAPGAVMTRRLRSAGRPLRYPVSQSLSAGGHRPLPAWARGREFSCEGMLPGLGRTSTSRSRRPSPSRVHDGLRTSVTGIASALKFRWQTRYIWDYEEVGRESRGCWCARPCSANMFAATCRSMPAGSSTASWVTTSASCRW